MEYPHIDNPESPDKIRSRFAGIIEYLKKISLSRSSSRFFLLQLGLVLLLTVAAA